MVYINVEIISIVLDDEQTVYDQTSQDACRYDCLISFFFISAGVCLFQSLLSYLYSSFYFYGSFFYLYRPHPVSLCAWI